MEGMEESKQKRLRGGLTGKIRTIQSGESVLISVSNWFVLQAIPYFYVEPPNQNAMSYRIRALSLFGRNEGFAGTGAAQI